MKLENEISMMYKYDENNKTIYLIKDNNVDEVIEDNFPSRPVVSPSGNYISYIAPNEWETIGKLFLFNLKTGEKKLFIDPFDGNLVPKSVIWINDNKLAVIVGQGYGTVAVGGNVMILNLNNNQTKYITNYPSKIQVTEMNLVNKNTIHIKGIEYTDEDFIASISFSDVIEIDF